MDYSVAIHYKTDDSKHRAKSVMHFNGETLQDIIGKVMMFKTENPQYTIGAMVPGIHTTI